MQVRRFATALAVAFCGFAAVQGADSSSSSSDNSVGSAGSGSESLLELLHEVQDAVAGDPALAEMFNITDASQMSEAELEQLLREILDVSSVSASGDASVGSSSEAVENSTTTDAPATAAPPSTDNAARSAHGASSLATVTLVAGASIASAVFL